jgi:hypothetical protein
MNVKKRNDEAVSLLAHIKKQKALISLFAFSYSLLWVDPQHYNQMWYSH